MKIPFRGSISGYAKHAVLCTLLSATFILTLGLGIARAQGDLMVNPRRVVFEDPKRTETVTLFNSGKDTATYAISLINYRMLPDGRFQEVPADSVANPGDKLLKYFPRQITLAPQGSQAVRVQVSKPQDLAPGEYRSHLYFRAVEKTKAIDQTQADTSKGIQVAMRPIFGISIPLIVRHKSQPASAKITSLEFGKDSLGSYTIATIGRSGEQSLYGSLVLKYIGNDGAESQIGVVKGVSVYYPNATRQYTLRIPDDAKFDPKHGRLRMEYQSLSDTEKESLLAQTEITLK
jgi:P pilus assembly chaperone PapD